MYYMQAAVLLLVATLSGGVSGWYASTIHKKPDVTVRPVAVLRGMPGTQDGASALTSAERRAIATAWGSLEQSEIDALSKALSEIAQRAKIVPVKVFCESEAKCGDMQSDFENAFETAHWDVSVERPLIDDTVGVAVSSEELRDAINGATNGRLAVKLIPRTAPYYALAIGRKPK